MTTPAPVPARPSRLRRILKVILFLVVIDGALLGAAELIVGWVAPPYHRVAVRKQNLAEPAPAGTKRVFLFGESTIDGWPYGSEASIARWLEETLKDVLPGQPTQVANFGKPGCGSYHLAAAVRETLALRPAVVIVCVGHNELLARSLALSTRAGHCWRYFHLDLYRCLYDKAMNWRAQTSEAPTQADVGEGLRAAAIREPAAAAFRANLDRIAGDCRAAGVPLLFCVPGANLDWAPAGLGTEPTLSAEANEALRQRIMALLPRWRRGEWEEGDFADLAQAPRQPLLHYWQGRLRRERQEEAAAFASLTKARDDDASPLRGVREFQEAMRAAGAAAGAPVVDMPLAFAVAAQGVPDSTWFMDHCHPRPVGQRLMAAALARELAKQEWLAPAAAWSLDRQASAETIARRLGVPAERWRGPERDSLLKQLPLRPELAADLAQRPPLLAPADDVEWKGLRAVALWRCGRRGEALLAFKAAKVLPASARGAWPALAAAAWSELEAAETTASR